MGAALEHDLAAPLLDRRDRADQPGRSAWLPLILVMVAGTAYGLFLVVPYYVNDLDRFALSELAYGAAPDASEIWPYANGGLLSLVWVLGVMLTVGLAPFITLGAPMWAAVIMWRDRRALPVRESSALAMSVLLGVVLIAELASPFHAAIIEWWLE